MNNQEEPRTDANSKFDWSIRFRDPAYMMRWSASIQVEPANSEKGYMRGVRIYPNGVREEFTVK